jgi:hypothetical protein
LSEDLWVADPETAHRRRAVWGLTILGLAAVIVVALMVFLIGSSGSDNNGLPNTSDIPELSSNPGSSQHSSSHSASSSSSASASSSASTAATTKCSSGSSCTLDGDAGHVIDAINNFRATNGRSVVPGTTTSQAKTCSLNNGGGDCPTSYFWEPVSPQDGAAVVEKIASRSSGRSFLLDQSMKSVQIGWAYVGGQYSCTIVAVT